MKRASTLVPQQRQHQHQRQHRRQRRLLPIPRRLLRRHPCQPIRPRRRPVPPTNTPVPGRQRRRQPDPQHARLDTPVPVDPNEVLSNVTLTSDQAGRYLDSMCQLCGAITPCSQTPDSGAGLSPHRRSFAGQPHWFAPPLSAASRQSRDRCGRQRPLLGDRSTGAVTTTRRWLRIQS